MARKCLIAEKKKTHAYEKYRKQRAELKQTVL